MRLLHLLGLVTAQELYDPEESLAQQLPVDAVCKDLVE